MNASHWLGWASLVLLVVIVLAVVAVAAMPSSSPPVDSISNLHDVGGGVWRGAQPTTIEAWDALYAKGVRHVLKLNFDVEGDDDLALGASLTVDRLSIQPEGDQNIVADVEGTFVEPDPVRLAAALTLLKSATPTNGWFVHCTHGQDRTGLVVAMLRVRRDGWSHAEAFTEALRYGFHPELEGLLAAWIRFTKEKASS